jgi:hypothetical protein
MNNVASSLAASARGQSMALDNAFDVAENAFLAWKWNGASIADIDARARSFGLTLDKLVEHYPSKVQEFAATVPAEYRGRVQGATSGTLGHGENSLAKIDYYVEILAIDQQGRALVEKFSVDTYTDAEASNVLVMSHQEALQLVDQYREEYRLASDPDAELSQSLRM